jgi:hypothetical protein
MAAPRFLYLFNAPPAALPSHRREGFSASATLHVMAFALLTAVPPAPHTAERPIVVASVPPEAIVMPADDAAPSEPPPDAAIAEDTVEGPRPEGPPLEVAGLELDIAKVRRQRDALFPFATGPLPFLDAVMARYRRSPDRPVNPFGPERRPSGLPPLALDLEARQQLIDRSWSRRERWDNFQPIAALLSRHDPDEGDAPALIRMYLEQNLLQPYFDTTTRDPRFWVMLDLAADHTRLIDFIGTFVTRHPSSKTTTELLFMLDEFAQASRDAMLMLLSTAPKIHLGLTRNADPNAYALALSIHEQYHQWARQRGLDATEPMRAYFDDIRLRILGTLIAATPEGYGAGDARFLMGRILWDRHDRAGAFRVWREMAPDGRNSYANPASAIARELAIGDVPAVNILRILGEEHSRWIAFSSERLAEFGYEVDTF